MKFDENIQIAEDKYFLHVINTVQKIVYQDSALYYYESFRTAMKSDFNYKQLDRKIVNNKLYDMRCLQFTYIEAFFMKNML